MGKHAYMIVAHNEFKVLAALLRMIDDERNDIYVHIDKRVADIERYHLEANVQKGNLIILQNRISVMWGDYSLVKCVLQLLSEATKDFHDYYHLLSGVDLPLKNQNSIHKFFEQCGRKEFVHMDSKMLDRKYLKRVDKYWLFNGRKKKLYQKIMNRLFLLAQFRIHRCQKSNLQYQKGANWFSITDEFARYIVSQKNRIKKFFSYTNTADEMFVQTMLMSSDFQNRLFDKRMDGNYEAVKREIDWQRGKPYVYRIQDLELLLNSTNLFARKFSWNLDNEIIKTLEKKVSNR